MTDVELTRVAAAAQEHQGDLDPIDRALTQLNALVTPRAKTLQPGRATLPESNPAHFVAVGQEGGE